MRRGTQGGEDDFFDPLFFYRQERTARICDGPDEMHKIVLARRVLCDHGNKGVRS